MKKSFFYLLIILLFIKNTEQQYFIKYEVTLEIKQCLSSSLLFSEKKISKIDFMTLDLYNSFSGKQKQIIYNCYSKVAPINCVNEITSVYSCLLIQGDNHGISVRSVEEEYLNCCRNEQCQSWMDLIKANYINCINEPETCCYEDDGLARIIKDCVDSDQNFNYFYNVSSLFLNL